MRYLLVHKIKKTCFETGFLFYPGDIITSRIFYFHNPSSWKNFAFSFVCVALSRKHRLLYDRKTNEYTNMSGYRLRKGI